MVYAPKRAIVVSRAIPENLLTYLTDATRLEDALTWAGDGSLKLLKKYSTSVVNRDSPVFPAIAYNDDDDAKDYTQDIVPAEYKGMFEVSIQASTADTAVSRARTYAKALESLIVNCPLATALNGTGAIDGILNTVEIGFEPIKAHEERKNDFLQQFQIRVTYSLVAGSHT